MPSEMRRPGPIQLAAYTDTLDLLLRDEAVRMQKRRLPLRLHRLARSLRGRLKPILQSGAMVLTSLAVIVAVGVAPASMRDPEPADTLLAAPSTRSLVVSVERAQPPGRSSELIAAVGLTGVRIPEIPDTPRVDRK